MIRKGKNLDGVLIEGVDKYPALLTNDRSIFKDIK